MTLTAAQLHHLMPEIGDLVGGIVRKIWCQSAVAIVLEARLPGRNRFLLLGLEERAARACLVQSKPAQPPRPAAFVMLLRKHLTGARVLSAAQIAEDRILRVDFDGFLRSDDEPEDVKPERARFALVAELTPRFANLFLLDAEGCVRGSLLDARRERRSMVSGEPYTPPEPPPEAVRERSWKDPLALTELPDDGARSQRVDGHYTVALARAEAVSASRALLKRLRRQRKAAKRRLTAVEADVQRAEEADTWKRRGELLQSAYGKVPRGSDKVEVPDFYAEGTPLVTISLDPAMDLQGNIARCFKRYRKYSGAEETILGRLEETESAMATISSALAQAEALVHRATAGALGTANPDAPSEPLPLAEAAEAVLALTARFEGDGTIPVPRQQQQKRSGGKAAPALPYRPFESRAGLAILVGKGGKDNDAVSLKVARGSDLWLHAHNWAGAHVIVRLTRGQDIDHESLLDAATLAAHYSKGKNDTLVEVLYTHAKHVRKPKGLPPGRVTVGGGKTIAVRLDKARIDRLFASRPTAGG